MSQKNNTRPIDIFVQKNIDALEMLKNSRTEVFEAINLLDQGETDISEVTDKIDLLDQKIGKFEADLNEFLDKYNLSIDDYKNFSLN